jgi:hypothetical protein
MWHVENHYRRNIRVGTGAVGERRRIALGIRPDPPCNSSKIVFYLNLIGFYKQNITEQPLPRIISSYDTSFSVVRILRYLKPWFTLGFDYIETYRVTVGFSN